jgi:hypothetical protein
MAEAGILREDDRVELIEGEIFQMSPIGSRHAARVTLAEEALRLHIREAVIVRIQSPVRLDDYSEPEPDIAVVKRRPDRYGERHPGPADVLLILELSETSSAFDRQVKAPLYARAGIAELWLELISEDSIEVYTEPVGGIYTKVRQVRRGESLSPLAFPEIKIPVEELLG